MIKRLSSPAEPIGIYAENNKSGILNGRRFMRTSKGTYSATGSFA